MALQFIINVLALSPAVATDDGALNGCFGVSYDYNGNDIAGGQISNVADARICQNHCEKKTGCLVFTWSKNTKECFLKHTKATPNRATAAISGPKTCVGADREYVGCFNDNKGGRRDLDTRQGNGKTLEECAQACDGYKYFGRQFEIECYCGDTYGSQGEAEADSCKCDNPSDIGGNVNCVYHTRIRSPRPASHSIKNAKAIDLFPQNIVADEDVYDKCEANYSGRLTLTSVPNGADYTIAGTCNLLIKPHFDKVSGRDLSIATAADKDYLGKLVDMSGEEVTRLLEGEAGPSTQGNLFIDMDKECFIKKRAHSEKQDKKYNKDTKESFDSMSLSISGEASYGPVTASLKTKFGTTSSESEQVISRQFWAQAFVYKASITNKCLRSSYYFQQDRVISGIVRDYQGLNTPEPAFTSAKSWRSHWRPVHEFFKKYGTHVITEVWFGAKINSFAYKKTTEAMNQTDFEAEACVGAKGATAAVSACAGISTQSKDSSASSSVKETHWNRNVTGNFAGAMTDGEAVKKFMAAVSSKKDEDQLVAKEAMKPIWEILGAGMGGPKNAASNLENYFRHLYTNGGMDYCADANRKEKVILGWKVQHARGGKCICGVDTICREGDVCIEDDCIGQFSPWGCGRCVNPKNLKGLHDCGHQGCDKGEGDCDVDTHCKGNLVCGDSNCRRLRKELYGETAEEFAKSKLATAYAGIHYQTNDDCCCAEGQCFDDTARQRRALLQRSSKGRSTTSTPPSASWPRTTSMSKTTSKKPVKKAAPIKNKNGATNRKARKLDELIADVMEGSCGPSGGEDVEGHESGDNSEDNNEGERRSLGEEEEEEEAAGDEAAEQGEDARALISHA